MHAKQPIFCQGDDELSRHPGIYLIIPKQAKSIICPYCSKSFSRAENEDQ